MVQKLADLAKPKLVRKAYKPQKIRNTDRVKGKMKIPGSQNHRSEGTSKNHPGRISRCRWSGRDDDFPIRGWSGRAIPFQPRKDRQRTRAQGMEFTNGDSPPSVGEGIGVRLNYARAAVFAKEPAQAPNDSDRYGNSKASTVTQPHCSYSASSLRGHDHSRNMRGWRCTLRKCDSHMRVATVGSLPVIGLAHYRS